MTSNRENVKIRKLYLLISIMITMLFLILPNAPGKVIEDFENDGGSPDITYNLVWDEEKDIGMEAKGYFEIPSHRGDIKNASLEIKCMPDVNGNYLTNPKLDIGLDGDYEWQFTGKGYGKAGHQYLFSSDRSSQRVTTTGQGSNLYNNKTHILLPKTADVSSATMKIKGGPGDYLHDLMVGIRSSGNIYYFTSNGQGGFGSPTNFGDVTNGYSYGIGLDDFDNDNDLDIVYGERGWSSSAPANFHVIRNTNYNGLSASHPWGNSPSQNSAAIGQIPSTSWGYVYDLAIGDFDNDGNLDFITNLRGNSYYLFLGRGDLTFEEPKTLSVTYPGTYAMGKDAADFNNDGNMDFVAGGTASNQVYYYEGKGDGTFKTGKAVASGPGNYQYTLTTADFNDDSNPDIITKGRQSGTTPYALKFIAGNGDGTFNNPMDTSITFSSWWDYVPADGYDFNYDGYQDLAVLESSSFYYYEGQGNGNFVTRSSIGSASSSIYSVAAPTILPLGRCENLTLNIGDDVSIEKQFSGVFSSIETVNIKNSLNSLIQNPTNLEVVTDNYGNEMYKIPIGLESDEVGSVLLQNLDIKYNYTATAYLLPGLRYNLTTDLNDLLPKDKDPENLVPIYLGVYSETPGKVKLSDLHIEYNGAPESNQINSISVNEDSDTKTLDLTELDAQNKPYFDDEDAPDKLDYGVYSNNNEAYVKVSVIDDYWLKVNCTEPNWYGTTKVILWCKDTEGIQSLSNEFEVVVKPLNDPPMANNPVPNVKLREGQSKLHVDLDDADMEYFIDIDSDELFYRAALVYPETYGDQLAVQVISTTNELQVSSIGSYAKNIEVRVYCDDDAELLIKSISELELVETYQTIFVNVTSSTATFPPQWKELTLDPIEEDTPHKNLLPLTEYVTDDDDEVGNLSFSVHSLTQSGFIDVIIEDNNWLSIYPHSNFDSTAIMTLAVTDDEHNSDLTSVAIGIIPDNDQPIVEISEPIDGSRVKGVFDVIGSAYDPENDLVSVEISIDDGAWTPVNGKGYWTYKLDTSMYNTKNELTIQARAQDGMGTQSLPDKITVVLTQPTIDSDGDGVEDIKDKFDNDPTEWKDSDNDGFGDNEDEFPNDDTQWSDSDGDEYGDDIRGNKADKFPHDPTQWNDTDRDEHGDNLWGNSGDYYPTDPDAWEKIEDTSKGPEEKSSTEYTVTFAMIGLIVVVIFTVIIFISYGLKLYKYKKESKK